MIDLSEFTIIGDNGDNEEWVIWDNPGKSVRGWITDFTNETLQGRDTLICHMTIDVENDQEIGRKNVKFVMPIDLYKKIEKAKTTILNRFNEYKFYIRFDDVKALDRDKKYKVFTVALKKEDKEEKENPSSLDDIEF